MPQDTTQRFVADDLFILGQRFIFIGPFSDEWPANEEPLADGEQIVCHEQLGGLLKHYQRVAA